MRALKSVIQFAGSFADYRDVSANGIHNQRPGSPVVATGDRVLHDTAAGIADVHDVDQRILGWHNGLQRHRLGKDTVPDVGMDAIGFDQVHLNAQQVLKITEQATQV